MRLIGKVIILIILILFGVYIYSKYVSYRTELTEDNVEQEKELYISHSAYQIANNESLSYSLPKNATNFKILVYPIIENELYLELKDKQNLEKQIDLSLNLNYEGGTKKQDYKAEIKTYSHINTNELIQPFWINEEQTVLLSKTLEFEVPKSKDIKFYLSSEKISSYLVRTYYQQRQSRTRVKQRWLRTSERRKANLLKYYPFDADNVSNSEINSLYKNSWSSVAPNLEGGSELKAARLFEYENRDELISINNNNLFSSSDIYLPKNSKYTFKVLNKTNISLDLELLNASDDFKAVLTHKNENALIKSSSYVKADFKQLTLEPGQYELSFTTDIAFRFEAESEEAIEKPDTFTSLYKLNVGESISYAVKSLPDINEYYKAAFHGLGGVDRAKLRIDTYSGDKLIDRKLEEIEFQVSEYMPYVTSRELGLQNISGASEKSIAISDIATRLEITAIDQPVSVSLSNTVSGLAAIKRITNASANSYQNAWFVLKPEQALEFLRDNKVNRYLNIESNAIQTDRVAQSFEKIRPLNSRRFKVVYYKNKSTIYSGNSAVNFRKINTRRTNSFNFQDKRTVSKKTLRPTLIIESKKPTDFSNTIVTLDGKTIELEQFESMQEFLLPKIQANTNYALSITPQSNRNFYINYTSVNDTMLSKRQLFKANKVTKYRFYKRDNVFESLSINILNNKSSAFEIKTSLLKDGLVVRPQKTPATRRIIFDTYDENLSKNMLRNSECRRNCYLYTPQFLPLYEDLSAGWYELHIEIPGNTQLYLDVSKTYYQEGSQSIIFSDELQN